MIALVAIALLLAGWALLSKGLRGIRIDDHPHCAACGFDLDGIDTAPTCPECGGAVNTSQRRIIGTFRRKPRHIAFGSVLLAIGGLLLANSLFGWTKSSTFYSKMPLWALEHLAVRDFESQSAWDVREELIRRASAGTIPDSRLESLSRALLAGRKCNARSQSQIVRLFRAIGTSSPARDTILDWALKLHSDRTQALHAGISDILDAELFAGRLSADRMKSYIRHCVRPQLILLGPHTCAPDEDIPVEFRWDWRGGEIPLAITFELPGITGTSRFGPPFTDSFDSVHPFLDRLQGTLKASSISGSHEFAGRVSLSLTGPLFAAGAPQSRWMTTYPGGISRIPPITVTFPMTARYTVDPTLPDTPAARIRRRLMRAVMVRTEDAAYAQPPPLLCAMSVRDFPHDFSAKADVRWRGESTSCAQAKFSVRDGVIYLGLAPAGGSASGPLYMDCTAEFDPGRPLSDGNTTLVVSVHDVRIFSDPAMKIEPFDLGFDVSPDR